jgi:hypothetical protein
VKEGERKQTITTDANDEKFSDEIDDLFGDMGVSTDGPVDSGGAYGNFGALAGGNAPGNSREIARLLLLCIVLWLWLLLLLLLLWLLCDVYYCYCCCCYAV